MKRASYREAIEWIARNDSVGDVDAFNADVQYLVSAILIADIFDVPTERVGADIVRKRKQLRKNGEL